MIQVLQMPAYIVYWAVGCFSRFSNSRVINLRKWVKQTRSPYPAPVRYVYKARTNKFIGTEINILLYVYCADQMCVHDSQIALNDSKIFSTQRHGRTIT